jgi:hypothetical protein
VVSLRGPFFFGCAAGFELVFRNHGAFGAALLHPPRNHLNLQQEVACFGRPLRICGGAQHRREIPLQFDSELSLAAGLASQAGNNGGRSRHGIWIRRLADVFALRGRHRTPPVARAFNNSQR